MRCSLLRDTVPLTNELDIRIDGKKKPLVVLKGLNIQSNVGNPVSDLVALLTSADVGFKLEDGNVDPASTTFSYITSKDWTMNKVEINGKVYYLYQNKLTFGVVETELVLSFIAKDKTSDSRTFYEDLVGEVLVGNDVKRLAWLLAVGGTITGRKLTAVKMNSRLEKVNELSIYNPVLQVQTSNSPKPKTMYLTANDMACVLDLNTVESVTVRKTGDTILIVFTTKGKLDYILEFS